MDETMLASGFQKSDDGQRWVGHGHTIEVEHIVELQVWELDQVIAGAKRGATSISLGPDKVFEFNA